jgi:hypothetical protein
MSQKTIARLERLQQLNSKREDTPSHDTLRIWALPVTEKRLSC